MPLSARRFGFVALALCGWAASAQAQDASRVVSPQDPAWSQPPRPSPVLGAIRGPSSLAGAIAGDWRTPGNVARDRYRHPLQTLQFFALSPQQTVVEITPGGGWYSEILAPYLSRDGQYIGAQPTPARRDGEAARDSSALADKFKADPLHYGKARIIEFDPKAPVFGPPASADVVLTFRNVHNWIAAGNADAYFKAFYAVLKPGGTLGVVDHRAKAGASLETMQKSGYLTTQMVLDLARAAGFQLVGSSEINANPKDTTDHPNGVWTLPPTNQHDAADDAMYRAIGESDRMTLRFVKPRHN